MANETFKEYLERNSVDITNDLAVGQCAKAYLRNGELTEEEKPWVNKCLIACDAAIKSWQREKEIARLDKLLPKYK